MVGKDYLLPLHHYVEDANISFSCLVALQAGV